MTILCRFFPFVCLIDIKIEGYIGTCITVYSEFGNVELRKMEDVVIGFEPNHLQFNISDSQ